MKITFKSTIKNGDDKNIIEFKSPVTITNENGFDIYEFIEPQNNVMNRIEISDTVVNIFAGPSTIVLSLGESIANEYDTEAGPIFFDAELKKLSKKENQIKLEYTLGQVNNPFGHFKIELDIEK